MAVLLFAAFAGLTPADSKYKIPNYKQSDKVLHFLTFFLLTVSFIPGSVFKDIAEMLQLLFYWILETNRRRNLQLTLVVCPVILGLGSEVVQGILPVRSSSPNSIYTKLTIPQNGREFDYWDIAANEVGCLLAIALSTWYHKRMLERKRAARSYLAVPGDDIELGEGVSGQETGVIDHTTTVDEELDNWDENAEDWETTEPAEEAADGQKAAAPGAAAPAGVEDGKKRSD